MYFFLFSKNKLKYYLNQNKSFFNNFNEYLEFIAQLVNDETNREERLYVIHQRMIINSYKNHNNTCGVLILEPNYNIDTYSFLDKICHCYDVYNNIETSTIQNLLLKYQDVQIKTYNVIPQNIHQLIGSNKSFDELVYSSKLSRFTKWLYKLNFLF